MELSQPLAASARRASAASLWLRVALLGGVGLVAAAFGLARHVPPIVLGDASAIDVAGAAVCLAGLALVAVAFRTALRGRRLRWKLAAIPVILLLLQFYVFPVVLAGLAVNADRFDLAPAHRWDSKEPETSRFRLPTGRG